MAVRVELLSAPFTADTRARLTGPVYRLHCLQWPQHSGTLAADSYGSLIESISANKRAKLVLAVTDSGSVVGFALIQPIIDTFQTHRLLIHELIVDTSHRRTGVGSALLRCVETVARDTGAKFLTAEVPVGWVGAQPFLARAKWSIQAFSFIQSITEANTNTVVQSPKNPAINTCLINSHNYANPRSQSLLRAAESIYRQLRPLATQLPHDTEQYLQTLRKVIDSGPAFAFIAYEDQWADGGGSEDGEISVPRVYGVAMCRRLLTAAHGPRLHVDDLITDEKFRSRGVGATLLSAIRTYVQTPLAGSDMDSETTSVITLESGCHRLDAHRFYWRENFLVREHFWRLQLVQ